MPPALSLKFNTSPTRKGQIMTSEAQKRASAKYRKRNVKSITVAFYPNDRELFEWTDSQGGRASYIKRLIAEDMERRK